MAIRVTCDNGHTINAGDRFAGKRVRCPKCQTPVQIPPVREPELESTEEPTTPAPLPNLDDALADLSPTPLGVSPQPDLDDPFAAPDSWADGSLTDMGSAIGDLPTLPTAPAIGAVPSQPQQSTAASGDPNAQRAVVVSGVGATAATVLLCLISVVAVFGAARTSARVTNSTGDTADVSGETPSVAPASPAANPPVIRPDAPSEVEEMHFKLIALGRAFSSHHDEHRQLAPHHSETQLSWRVHLLPYVGEQLLYHKFHLDEPWDSAHNKKLIDQMPDIYRIAGRSGGDTRIQCFSGPGMLFGEKHLPRPGSGPADTIMLIVVGPDKVTPWTRPDDLMPGDPDPLSTLGSVGETIQCLALRGHVMPLSRHLAEDVLVDLASINGDKGPYQQHLRANRRRQGDRGAGQRMKEKLREWQLHLRDRQRAYEQSLIPAAPQASPGKIVTLMEPANGNIAFSRKTGDVAIVNNDSNNVYVYRAAYFDGDNTAVVGPLADLNEAASDATKSVAFKPFRDGVHLLLGSGGKITFIDTETWQPAAETHAGVNPFDLKTEFTALSTSGDPNDPHVFIDTLKDRQPEGHLVNLKHGGIRSPGFRRSHGVLSESGRLLFTNSDSEVSTYLRRPVNTPGYSQTWSRESVTRIKQGFAIDPLDQILVSDESIQLIGRNTDGIPLESEPLCVFERRPWILIRDQFTLRWLNRDGRRVAQILLPGELRPGATSASDRLERGGVQMVAFDDAGRDRVLIGRGSAFWALPQSTVDLPEPPLVTANLPLPPLIAPYEEVSFRVEPASGVSVTLIDGPADAELVDGRFKWNPSRAYVGRQEFVFRHEKGNLINDQPVRCIVSNRAISLPFPSGLTTISEDGQFAITSSSNPRGFAVVDLKAQEMLASRFVDRAINRVAVTHQYAATLTAPVDVNLERGAVGDRIDVYSLPDLDLVSSQELAEPARDMLTVGDFLLVQAPGVSLLQLPGLVSPPELSELSDGNFSINKTTDGWIVGPAVYDESLKSVRFFYRLQQLKPLVVVEMAQRYTELGSRSGTVFRSSGGPRNGGMLRNGAVVSLHPQEQPLGKRVDIHLKRREEKDPLVAPFFWLSTRSKSLRFQASGQGIAAQLDGKLFGLFLENLPVRPTRGVYRLRPAPGQFMVSARGKTTVHYRMLEGEGTYKYGVTFDRGSPFEGMIVPGRKDGSFVVDGPAIAKVLLDGDRALAGPLAALLVLLEDIPPNKVVNAYLDIANALFARHIGRKLTGFPVALKVLSLPRIARTRSCTCHRT